MKFVNYFRVICIFLLLMQTVQVFYNFVKRTKDFISRINNIYVHDIVLKKLCGMTCNDNLDKNMPRKLQSRTL